MSAIKKSVSIEGSKTRVKNNVRNFRHMDQKNQLQIKRLIQSAVSSDRLDLSEKQILTLNPQIADLCNSLKVLHLQKNRIHTLPSEIGCLSLGKNLYCLRSKFNFSYQ